MAHPFHHAESSARKFGGEAREYLQLHQFLDGSKEHLADFRHRALRHHSEGIFMLEKIFGTTITLSTGRVLPVRFVGEQHARSVDQRTRDRHALTLAAREFGRAVKQSMPEPAGFEEFGGAIAKR